MKFKYNNWFILNLGFILILIVFLFCIFDIVNFKDKYIFLDEGDVVNFTMDDLKNCAKINDSFLKNSCETELLDLCVQDECFFEKAGRLNDESVCFDIKDESKRVMCSSLIKVSNIKEDAVLSGNISRCLDFENDVMILRCEDNFYLAKRFNEDDFSVCDNIVDEVLKNECIK